MSVTQTRTVEVTDEQKRQYEDVGFTVLERVIPPEHLEMLRAECGRLMGLQDAEMDRRGTDHMGLSFRGRRYFLSMWHQPDTQPIKDFVFSDVMADICRALLGDTAFLAFEQFVIKGPEQGMSFAWHQDSGYVARECAHQPYLTCWCMLDDVTEENGTVYMLPYDRAGTRERVEHTRDEEKGDLIGYFGDDPGVPVVAPAGSIACFASTVFHRSGPNTTDRFRRIFLPQYSAAPILKPGGVEPYYLAEPFLKGGQFVAEYLAEH